ncbi:MAG: hypothetical protein IJD82_01275 [Clostridia bacterium]|nr:hypothetical protein [Clostridia bacterium]
MHTKHPDGFAIHEIREQLLNKAIDIHSLDIETIRALYDYELAWAELDKSDSPTVLMELLDVLQQAGEPNDAFDIVSSERCMELAADALAQNERTEQEKLPRKRKKIILLAAAILVLSSTCVGIAASSNGPLANFFENAADVLNLEPGEVLVSGNQELTADKTTRFYDSFDALMQEEGISVLYPRGIALQDERSLNTFWGGETRLLLAKYEFADLLVEYVNSKYTESDLLERMPDKTRYEINGRIYYDLSGEGIYQLEMFDGGYHYIITANNHTDLLAFAELIE